MTKQTSNGQIECKQTTHFPEAALDLPPPTVPELRSFVQPAIRRHRSINSCRVQQPRAWCVNTPQSRGHEMKRNAVP